MTDLYSDDHIVALVPGLTADRLLGFVQAQLVIPTVRPAAGGAEQLFTRIDMARLQLLCELTDDLALDDAALGVVMALVDSLHAARHDLRRLFRAVDAEAPEIRARIGMVVARSGP